MSSLTVGSMDTVRRSTSYWIEAILSVGRIQERGRSSMRKNGASALLSN